MNEVLGLTAAMAEGAALGAFFFAGLWWTVRMSTMAKNVALLFLGSMLIRSAIVVLGFYFILGDNWQRLLAGLLGFVIARIIVTRFIRISTQSQQHSREDDHAS